MPTCLRFGYVGNLGAGANSALLFPLDASGSSVVAGSAMAVLPIVDTGASDLSKCAAVAITGTEYQAIQVALNQQGPSTGTGAGSGVSADVFMGAALVAVVAIGWIAGAQR